MNNLLESKKDILIGLVKEIEADCGFPIEIRIKASKIAPDHVICPLDERTISLYITSLEYQDLEGPYTNLEAVEKTAKYLFPNKRIQIYLLTKDIVVIHESRDTLETEIIGRVNYIGLYDN
ncbi:MAG: hypothetical protein ABIP54_04160 [Candidatus Andersenbacteria bacterium]